MKYGNISEIAQYNRENGTNFYTMEQVEKHKKENNPSLLTRLAQTTIQVPVTSGTSTSAATSLRDIPKVESTVGNELGYAAGLLTTPMLLGEIGTYGPLVGALRLGAGSVGAASGSYVSGKAGDFVDKKLGTNWIGDTGRLLGGFAGFGAGMKTTTPLIRSAATRGLTLHMPQNTFMKVRGEGFDRAFNKIKSNSNLKVGPLRYTKKYNLTPDYSNMGISKYELFDTLTGKSIGKLGTTYDKRLGSNGIQHVDNIIASNGNRGVSRSLYNSALIDEPSGLISGENLVHPEITERVWKHFPREIVSNRGYRPSEQGSVAFGDVVRLKSAETYIPVLEKDNLLQIVPKQTRVVSEGTYPLYTGPKHSVTEVVNPDGTVNPRAALRIEREVADNIPGAYRMESRLENPEWHVNDPNTWAHTRNVAQSAWTIPTPRSLTKQDQMIAALGHDFGKIVSGDGHAQSSAALIEQIFPDVTEQQLTAISEHMGAPKSILGKVTKQADILNGKPAITRFVGDNGKIRLRLPSHTAEKPRELVLDPQGNNKFRVHTRTWDGDHIPAEMSVEDKNTLFNALYEELPEGSEILFPESGPGNYATRGTVAGLQRLARDSRFKPTGNGVLQYVDKDGSIKTFEGTGFRKQQGGTLKRK